MKAAYYENYGPPEVIEIREIETPAAQGNEVLVRVHAATVNRTDCSILTGKPFVIRFFTGLKKPRRRSTGTDFAGVIEAVGSAVTKFKPGDEVFGFDDTGLGSHAQYITISASKAIALIPAQISFQQAAASIEGAHYAFNFINKVKIREGSTVLVNGATGAIGSAAVQMLKYYGAEITAVCNTKNLDLVRELGATRVIDYEKEDFSKLDNQYDFIFDAVGKSSFKKCKPLLKSGGVYISSDLGERNENPLLALSTPLFSKKTVKFPIPLNPQRSLLFISKLIEEGKFKAVIDRSYSLNDIGEAFTYVLSGQKTGNVIVTIN